MQQKSAQLLLVGAAGKSAQIPLYVWLPDAMEGPTPSSAVFYGALSVHLGAYLLLRVSAVLAGIGAYFLTSSDELPGQPVAAAEEWDNLLTHFFIFQIYVLKILFFGIKT